MAHKSGQTKSVSTVCRVSESTYRYETIVVFINCTTKLIKVTLRRERKQIAKKYELCNERRLYSACAIAFFLTDYTR